MVLEITYTLLKRLNVVISKRAGIALAVWGEAGLGKTFAISNLQSQLSCRNLRVHATISSLALIQELPRPEKLPIWAQHLIERLEQDGHLEVKAFSTVLVAWLAALAPFVLHLEDLHETNLNQLNLWTTLASEMKRTRGVALVVSSRSIPPEVFDAVALEPLSDQAVVSLLEVEAGAALPVEALTWIAVRAHGNPLFSLEYFRHLTRLGHLWSDGRRWRWRAPEGHQMPTNVEAVIGHHILALNLTTQARSLLAVKALLPLHIADELISKIAQLEFGAFCLAQTELERGGLLRAGAFTHPLYRDVIRAETTPIKRHEIARRAIAILIENDPITAVTFETDANLADQEARDLLERAIASALEVGDMTQAALLTLRIAARSSLLQRFSLTLQAANYARHSNLGQALEIAMTALELDASNPEAVFLSAELLAEAGQGNQADQLLETFSRQLHSVHARLFEARLRVKHLSHDYAGVLLLWHSLPGLSYQPSIPLAVIARAFVQLARFEEAEAVIAKALFVPKLEPLELAELLYIQAFIPSFSGLYASANLGFSAFLHILNALNDGQTRFREMRSGALQLRAYTQNVLGQATQAVADIQAALQYPEEFGDANHHAQLQSELGLYFLETGEYQKAEEVLFEARAVLERSANPIYLSMLERITARLYLEWSPPHGAALALKHAQAALDTIELAGKPPAFVSGALFIAAWANAIHGDTQKALTLIIELEQLFIGPRQAALQTGAAWIRGLVFARQGLQTQAREAFAIVLNSSIPMALGPTLERMALEFDRITSDVAAAKTRVERAKEMGAFNLVNIAGRYFPTLETIPKVQTEIKNELIQNNVRLEVLGKPRIVVQGKVIKDQTRKGKELLFLLLQARLSGRPELSDYDLIETLYAQTPDNNGASALKQLVYRLRAQLGTSTILRVTNGYALGKIETDAEEFLITGNSKLWTGTTPEEFAGSTALEALQYALRKKIKELIEPDANEAVRLGRILLEIDPFDLEAYRLSLRALQQNGDDLNKLQLISWLRKRFAEIGEDIPNELEFETPAI